MIKIFFFLSLAWAVLGKASAQEIPRFSVFFHGGADLSAGYLPSSQPGPEGGLGIGMSLNSQLDGIFTLDYASLSCPVQIQRDGTLIQATDDLALTLGSRLYFWDKRDDIRQKFNFVPYLMAGAGLDFLVDQYPRDGAQFWQASYDILFSMEAGAGMDFPLDKQWIFYTEGVDHLIVWDGLTQVFSLRVGLKIMLDSAHADPLRGVI